MQLENTGAEELPLVYVIGDSVSIQYGPYLERALAGMFRYGRKDSEAEALLNLDTPVGANAGDSAMLLDFLQTLLKSRNFNPDVLLLNCGLHDIKRDVKTGAIQVPLERYEANLRRIVKLCRSAGICLVWARTTPLVDCIHNGRSLPFHRYAEDLAAYNGRADRIMTKSEVPIIDLFAFTQTLGSDSDLFCDHVHFRDEIRERQGVFLAGCLMELKAAGKLRPLEP